MRRSEKLRVISALLALAGIALATVWVLVSFAAGVGLAYNGPWLVVTLVLVLAAVFAFGSMVAESRERAESDRGRRDARR